MDIDINQLSIVERLGGGVNNGVYKAIDNQARIYCLKIYKPRTVNDQRNRGEKEFKFLKAMNSLGIKNVPELVYGNTEHNWGLLSWIDGKKIKELDGYYISQIGEFIVNINKYITFDARFGYASHALTAIQSPVWDITRRRNRIVQIEAKSKYDEEIKLWVEKVLWPYAVGEIEKLLQNKRSEHWEIGSRELVLSPSDVGIHNLLCKERKLHFIDFEYSGHDDLSKLISDWVNQPEYLFSGEQENILISSIESIEERIGKHWRYRYRDIKNITRVKWCFIILNSYGMKDQSQGILEKAQSYYSHGY